MSVLRQANLLSQQRFDIPHLRGIESAVAADFDVLAGRSMSGQVALVLRGFTLANLAAGAPAVGIQLATADGIAWNQQATEAGTMLWVPADRAVETLNPVSNNRLSGGWTPSSVNYVGLDFVRNADAATTDLVQFLDASTKLETPKQVPLARTLDYRIVIGTVPFSGQPNLVPIAKVTLDGNGLITAVEDARPLMFRLGQGGDAPNKYGFFTGWTRKENFGTLDSTLFTGGDKGISNQKQWQDAVMTRLQEVGGGEFWYSAATDRNVNLVWISPAFSNGENFEWTGTNLHWKGIRLIFDNSTGTFNDVTDQLTDSPGLTDLADGECIYVDLNRTANNTILGQKSVLSTLGPGATPGSRWIIAWRVGGSIYTRGWRYPVGTLNIPATTTSQGVLKITRDYLGTDTVGASALNDPKALSDRGGTVFVPTAGVPGIKIRRFDAGADILQWRTAADGALGSIDNDGDINFAAAAREITWPGWRLTDTGVGTFRIQNIADADIRIDLSGNYNEFRDSSGTRAVRFSVGAAGVLFGSLTALPIFFEAGGNTWWRIASGTGQLTGLLSTGIDIDPTAEYTYTTARTARSKHLAASEFYPVDTWGNTDHPNVGVLSQQGPASRTAGWICAPRHPGQNARLMVRAPLNLPHGAAITGVTVLTSGDDGGTSQANTFGNIRLNVYNRTHSAGTSTITRLNTTGSINFSGTSGATHSESTHSFTHTVDNSGTSAYEIEIDMNAQWNWSNYAASYASINGGAAMALLPDGRILISGGYSGTTAIDTTKIYDPYTGRMTTVDTLNNARAGHKMAAIRTSLQGLKVIAFGGHTGDGTTRVQTTEIYDLEANTWTNMSGSMTNAIGFQWILHPRGDAVICVSGSTAGQEQVATLINDSGVTALASTNSNRVGGSLAWYGIRTGTGTDKVYLGVFGGGASFAGLTNTWESYDPFTDAWTTGTGTMNATRNLPGIHTTSTGQVLIAGGAASASAEYGDPTAATNINFTALTAPPTNFTTGQTFCLPSGEVLFLSSGSVAAQLFSNRGATGGSWSRLDSFGLSTLGSDQTGVGASAGQNIMLPTGELVGIAQAVIGHMEPNTLHFRVAMGVPTVRFHGLRVNYDLTEVNVEM